MCAATDATAAIRCLPLAARQPEGNYIVPGVLGDVVFRRVGTTELALDAYAGPRPEEDGQQAQQGQQKQQEREARRGHRARPGAIVIHGGNWERGSRAAFVGQFLELLTRAGYHWVSVDYRLGGLGRYTDAVEDVRAAVDFVRCHARELTIDPDRLVLFGEESGAQLAALLAVDRPAGVKAVVLIGGTYDLHALSTVSRADAPTVMVKGSPMHRIRGGMPAALVVHGTGDTEVPSTQAERYCAALRAARSPCTFLPVEGASRRAENWWPSQWGYKTQVLEWLTRTLSSSSRDSDIAGATSPTRAAAPQEGASIAAGQSSERSPHVTGLQKDIVFSPRHGLMLDAYVPPGPGPFAAVIIVHGGGWEAGDKVTYITPLLAPLARAGFAWFSIDYRLTPAVQHPQQLDDLRQAIRFVRANAERFNIDPQRVAILGESASGQMVTQLAATAPSSEQVAAVVSFYGVYDFAPLVADPPPSSPRSLLARLFGRDTLDREARALLREYSPLHRVTRDMPPTLLIHGTNERLWEQGQAMARALTSQGVAHELVALDGAPHGLENWEGHAPWMAYKPRLVAWLREQLGR